MGGYCTKRKKPDAELEKTNLTFASEDPEAQNPHPAAASNAAKLELREVKVDKQDSKPKPPPRDQNSKEVLGNLVRLVQDPRTLQKFCEALFKHITTHCKSEGLNERNLDVLITRLADADALEYSDVDELNIEMLFARFDVDSGGELDLTETSRLIKTIIRKVCDMKKKALRSGKTIDIPMIGKLDDRYHIKRKLGQGGQGAMCLATDNYGTEVCVKIYDKTNSNAPVEDIKAEFELMKELASPRVARTFDMFQDKCNVYLVNEPYYGRDLTYLISNATKAKVSVTEKWLSGIFAQVLEGLEYLHAAGVVHCDLKEANVMVSGADDWNDPNVVLIDFGLAQNFLSSEQGCSGTPGYIPPEALRSGYWVPKGDIFSAGVIFYQISTGGEVPWTVPDDFDDDDEDLWWAELERLTESVNIDWRGCKLSKALTDKFKSMLEKDFHERPTAEYCRKQEWFVHIPATQISVTTLANLARMHKANEVETACQEKILASCNLAQMRELNDLFTLLDTDNDGEITLGEAKSGLATLNNVPSDVILGVIEQLQKLGCLKYKDFMAQMINGQLKYDSPVFKKMFEDLDTNGDGQLSRQEISKLADMCGLSESLQNVLSLLDSDGDGSITFEEFMEACAGVPQTRPPQKTKTGKRTKKHRKEPETPLSEASSDNVAFTRAATDKVARNHEKDNQTRKTLVENAPKSQRRTRKDEGGDGERRKRGDGERHKKKEKGEGRDADADGRKSVRPGGKVKIKKKTGALGGAHSSPESR